MGAGEETVTQTGTSEGVSLWFPLSLKFLFPSRAEECLKTLLFVLICDETDLADLSPQIFRFLSLFLYFWVRGGRQEIQAFFKCRSEQMKLTVGDRSRHSRK